MQEKGEAQHCVEDSALKYRQLQVATCSKRLATLRNLLLTGQTVAARRVRRKLLRSKLQMEHYQLGPLAMVTR